MKREGIADVVAWQPAVTMRNGRKRHHEEFGSFLTVSVTRRKNWWVSDTELEVKNEPSWISYKAWALSKLGRSLGKKVTDEKLSDTDIQKIQELRGEEAEEEVVLRVYREMGRIPLLTYEAREEELSKKLEAYSELRARFFSRRKPWIHFRGEARALARRRKKAMHGVGGSKQYLDDDDPDGEDWDESDSGETGREESPPGYCSTPMFYPSPAERGSTTDPEPQEKRTGDHKIQERWYSHQGPHGGDVVQRRLEPERDRDNPTIVYDGNPNVPMLGYTSQLPTPFSDSPPHGEGYGNIVRNSTGVFRGPPPYQVRGTAERLRIPEERYRSPTGLYGGATVEKYRGPAYQVRAQTERFRISQERCRYQGETYQPTEHYRVNTGDVYNRPPMERYRISGEPTGPTNYETLKSEAYAKRGYGRRIQKDDERQLSVTNKEVLPIQRQPIVNPERRQQTPMKSNPNLITNRDVARLRQKNGELFVKAEPCPISRRKSSSGTHPGSGSGWDQVSFTDDFARLAVEELVSSDHVLGVLARVTKYVKAAVSRGQIAEDVAIDVAATAVGMLELRTGRKDFTQFAREVMHKLVGATSVQLDSEFDETKQLFAEETGDFASRVLNRWDAYAAIGIHVGLDRVRDVFLNGMRCPWESVNAALVMEKTDMKTFVKKLIERGTMEIRPLEVKRGIDNKTLYDERLTVKKECHDPNGLCNKCSTVLKGSSECHQVSNDVCENNNDDELFMAESKTRSASSERVAD